jgi:succinoglycan biosynthesis transport protein ExoP
MSLADPLPSLVTRARVSFDDAIVRAPRIADRSLACLLSPGSPSFEPFRVLRAKVKALGARRPVRCLGLVSATAHEGTSTVALGLAAALAQDPERRVLLVETAVRAPALEKKLGLPAEPGLGAWLRDENVRRGPRRLGPWGFYLLPGGPPTPHTADLLSSDAMARLLGAARQAFDFVLVDCPPLETVADSVILQDVLDGFLLVVRARHASRNAIRRSLSHLKPERILGAVLNDRTEILSRWLDRRRPRAKS